MERELLRGPTIGCHGRRDELQSAMTALARVRPGDRVFKEGLAHGTTLVPRGGGRRRKESEVSVCKYVGGQTSWCGKLGGVPGTAVVYIVYFSSFAPYGITGLPSSPGGGKGALQI